MLLFYWLLLYLLMPTCQCSWSILIVWGGEVEGVPEDFSESWDVCIDYCLLEESCVVIRQTASFGCQIFRYGNISSVQTTGTSKIGFKRAMTTCSLAMSSPPLFGEPTVTETYQAETTAYQYQITLSESDVYIFNFNYYVQCQNDSFVSLRGSKPVCISVRVFPNTSFCQNRASGLELCLGNGGMGMTGPYSMDEGKVMTEYMSDTLISAPTRVRYTYLDFWIDGTRDGLGNYTMTDDTLNGTVGYSWSGHAIYESYSCIFLVLWGGLPTAFGQRCSIDTDGKYCLRGAVCRTYPVIID